MSIGPSDSGRRMALHRASPRPTLGGGKTTGGRAYRLFGAACSAAALCVAAAPPPAQAAEPSEPSASEKDTARQLLDVGDAKYEAGDYQGALEAYQAADKIMGVPTTGVAVGRAQERLGLLVEARDTLLRVARFPKQPAESEVFAQARSEAARLATGLVDRIPTVKIEVTGAAEGTDLQVQVDGKSVAKGTLQFPRRVNPGEHVVTVRASGYRAATKTIVIAEAERKNLPIALERDPQASREQPAKPPSTPSSDDEHGLSPLVWVGFGVGAAGFIAGTVTGALAIAKTSSLRDTCGSSVCGPQHEDEVNQAEAIAHGSTVSFAIGGAGAALGVAALLWLSGSDDPVPDDATSEAAAVTPWVGVGWAGLLGRF